MTFLCSMVGGYVQWVKPERSDSVTLLWGTLFEFLERSYWKLGWGACPTMSLAG